MFREEPWMFFSGGKVLDSDHSGMFFWHPLGSEMEPSKKKNATGFLGGGFKYF